LVFLWAALAALPACARKGVSGTDGGSGSGGSTTFGTGGGSGSTGTAGRGGAGGVGTGVAGSSVGVAGADGGGGGTAGTAGAGGVPTSAACSSYEASAPVARTAPGGRPVGDGGDFVALSAVAESSGRTDSRWFQIRWTRFDRTGNVLVERTVYRAWGFDASGWPLDFGFAVALGLAPSDDGFGVLWYEDKDKRVMFARLDADGAPVGTAPLVVGAAKASNDSAALAWNGSTFGVTWVISSSRTLRFATLDRAGALVGSGEMLNVNPLITSLNLFGQRDDFLVLFEPYLPNLDEVRWTHFDQTGQPAGGSEAILLSDPTVYAGNLRVDRLPDRYTVTWAERPMMGNGARVQVLRQIDGAGTIVAGPFAVDLTAGALEGLAHNDHELGAIVGDSDALAFQALRYDGTLHGARIEIAPRAAPTTGGGIPVPTALAFTWQDDGFGVLFAGSGPAGWGTYYTFLRCVP